MFPFYTSGKPQKTLGFLVFSGFFRGYKMGTLAWNGLILEAKFGDDLLQQKVTTFFTSKAL